MKTLTLREKQVLLGGGGVVLVLLVVFGIVAPLADLLSGMDSRLAEKQEQVVESRLLQVEIARIKAQLTQLERKTDQQQPVSLFSLLEKNTEQLGFRDNLVSMRPQSSTQREGFKVEAVDLRLEKIRYDQLVLLLKEFEKAAILLNVRQLNVKKRFDDSTLVDVSLQVESVLREG